MRLIQSHLDRYGVTRATFAKRAGTTSQTVQNWKSRGGTLPKRKQLEGIARETGLPYLIVLDAALKDAGYRDSLADDLDTLLVRITRYVRDHDRGVGDLQDYLGAPFFPSDMDLERLYPGMSTAELNRFIDGLIAEAEARQYGGSDLFDREFLIQYLQDNMPESGAEDSERGWGPGFVPPDEQSGMGGDE